MKIAEDKATWERPMLTSGRVCAAAADDDDNNNSNGEYDGEDYNNYVDDD